MIFCINTLAVRAGIRPTIKSRRSRRAPVRVSVGMKETVSRSEFLDDGKQKSGAL